MQLLIYVVFLLSLELAINVNCVVNYWW